MTCIDTTKPCVLGSFSRSLETIVPTGRLDLLEDWLDRFVSIDEVFLPINNAKLSLAAYVGLHSPQDKAVDALCLMHQKRPHAFPPPGRFLSRLAGVGRFDACFWLLDHVPVSEEDVRGMSWHTVVDAKISDEGRLRLCKLSPEASAMEIAVRLGRWLSVGAREEGDWIRSRRMGEQLVHPEKFKQWVSASIGKTLAMVLADPDTPEEDRDPSQHFPVLVRHHAAGWLDMATVLGALKEAGQPYFAAGLEANLLAARLDESPARLRARL